MPLRVTFHESGDADSLVDTLLTARCAAGASRQRFAADNGSQVTTIAGRSCPSSTQTRLPMT